MHMTFSPTWPGNTYNIYRQDNPAIDMFTHLRLWLDYLEYAIGQKLQLGDYIFPYIASNGQVHMNRAISHDHVQAMITEFTTQAGLEKRYTTHCFCQATLAIANHPFMGRLGIWRTCEYWYY